MLNMMTCKNKKCAEKNPQPEEAFELCRDGIYTWRRGMCLRCRYLVRKRWGEENKKQFNAYMRKYNAEHKHTKEARDAYRNRRLKKRYGITLAQYYEKLASQGGSCELCPRLPGIKKFLSVDHHHKTGKTRGLLCDGCNRDIAILDDPGRLAKAMAYLKKYE